MNQWWRDQVVYQIYPRSFADSDGDGIGDLRGIIQRVDHLVELGVGVVWLSPVFCSPQDDNGYDISDYYDIDPSFGTLADFDKLVAALHEVDIKLVMDLVVNHTSDEHPWFVESRDPASARRDWYWWRPGVEGGPPTNWGSAFSGSAWELDERSGEYYLHLFGRKQPDLNWENPEVRRAVFAMMRWWVERGVDGFRMDVINLISKPVPLSDGDVPPSQAYAPGLAQVAEGPRLHEFLQEMYAEVLEGTELLTVGEMPGVTVEQARLSTAQDRHELDMVFTFEHMMLDVGADRFDLRPLSLPVLKKNLARWQEGLAEQGWNSLYWDNHDQPRAVSRFGDDSPALREASAKTLASVLHLHRGTPYVFQGEEIGMTNAGFDRLEQYRDIETRNHHRWAVDQGAQTADLLSCYAAQSRDNARTPMQWDDTEQAGFTTGTPWIEVNPNHELVNVADQLDDPDSVFSHFQALIALRRQDPVLVEGTFELLLPDHDQLWVIHRAATPGERSLLLVANCSSRPARLPEELVERIVAADIVLGAGAPHGAFGPAGRCELAAWESWVLREPADLQ